MWFREVICCCCNLSFLSLDSVGLWLRSDAFLVIICTVCPLTPLLHSKWNNEPYQIIECGRAGVVVKFLVMPKSHTLGCSASDVPNQRRLSIRLVIPDVSPSLCVRGARNTYYVRAAASPCIAVSRSSELYKTAFSFGLPPIV